MDLPFSPEALLAHRDFLRSLARHLLRDEQAAEDLEQETWLAVLRRPPAPERPPRPWIASIARNLARRSLRSDRRRRTREAEASARMSAPSTDEIVAREAIRRRLLDAVLELAPLYREAVLLRHYEDLSPREIARRLDVPLETVRTRLRRGLEMLRARMSTGDERGEWRFSLMPLLVSGSAKSSRFTARASFASGALVLSTSIKLIIALVLAVAAGSLGWWLLDVDTEPTGAVASEPSSDDPDSGHTSTLLAPPSATESARDSNAETRLPEDALHDRPGATERVDIDVAGFSDQAGDATTLVVLEIQDETGAWVEGAEVRIRSAEKSEERLSDSKGRVSLRMLPGDLVVQVDEDGWYCEPVAFEIGPSDVREPLVIVVERMAQVRGVVLDHLGRPLPGARVYCEETWNDADGNPHHWTSEWRLSDADGEYLVDEIVHRAQAESWIQAEHESYLDIARGSVVVLRGGVQDLAPIQFSNPGASFGGRALMASGEAAVGATVVVIPGDGSSARVTSCGSSGAFHMSGLRPQPHTLRLTGPDGSGARLELRFDGPDAHRDLGTITLDPAVHRLSGRVVDGSGSPVSGAEIRLRRPEASKLDPRTVLSSGTGLFELTAADPGPFELSVRWSPPSEPNASTRHDLGSVELHGGSREIRLRPGGLLFVPVEAGTSEPIRGWRGMITTWSPGELGEPATEPSGRNGVTNEGSMLRWLESEELKSGTWRFDIDVEGYRPVTVTRDLPKRILDEIRVPLRLERD